MIALIDEMTSSMFKPQENHFGVTNIVSNMNESKVSSF